jgi:ABC-type Mn2+/Zn2+ transport system permease subunit
VYFGLHVVERGIIFVDLALAQVVALVAGVAGLLTSVKAQSLDLPTGPTIVCCFGLLLLFCGAISAIRGRRRAEE